MAKKADVIPFAKAWEQYMSIRALAGAEPFGPAFSLRQAAGHTAQIASIMDSKETHKAKRSSSRRRDTGDVEHIAYRFYGKPDKVQAHQLAMTAGCCRFLWNRMKADYDRHKVQTGHGVIKTPAKYKDLDECAFLRDVDSYALCNVQLRFESAISDYLSGEKGEVRFKKKGVCKESYTTNKDSRSNNVFLDENGRLTLPKIDGPIKLRAHRKIKSGGKLKSVTVTREPNGEWYFTLLYEYPASERTFTEAILSRLDGKEAGLRCIGLDMSLPKLYIDSNGKEPSYIVNNVEVVFAKAYRRLEKRIAREQRKLSRMKRDSANYKKQCIMIAKLFAKTKHQRNDFLHQIACRLAREYDIIGIEDLDIAAIRKSLRFGKSVSDNGWGTFVDILEEQCRKYGSLLIRVDKWFPSSKKCCVCGHVNHELTLLDRTYICPKCGHVIDRDGQAAINIRDEALMIFDKITHRRAS